MDRKAWGAAAAAVAVLFAGLVSVLLVPNDDDDSEPEVKGVQITRSTTTTRRVPVDSPDEATTTTRISAEGDDAGASVVTPTTTTTTRSTRPRNPGTVAPTTTTTTIARPRGEVLEQSDNSFSFGYNGTNSDTHTSSTRIERGQQNPLTFMVGGGASNGVARFTADITNNTSQPVFFNGGVRIRWIISRNGATWRTVEFHGPAVQSLEAGGQLSAFQEAHLDGPGTYSFVGEVLVDYR